MHTRSDYDVGITGPVRHTNLDYCGGIAITIVTWLCVLLCGSAVGTRFYSVQNRNTQVFVSLMSHAEMSLLVDLSLHF